MKGNQIIKNRNTIFTTILLTCFRFFPGAQAVVPPPDGGYPGFNTAEGQNALFRLTTGVANTGVGWYSIWSNTDGSYNTALGAGTLLFNIGDQSAFEGVENTAIGAAALLFNTTGSDNTATGVAALLNNTEGSNNTASGEFALYSNTTGDNNTANGLRALRYNISGSFNTAIGQDALNRNTQGQGNIALGSNAGFYLTGSDNIDIGNSGFADESSTIRIGNDNHIACYISGIYGHLAFGGTAVYINSNGKLGTVTSSLRFKDDIKPMDQASEAILALKPVTFRYKRDIDPHGIPQFGLVAEDVEEINPDLVVRDDKGEIYSVRYDAVNAMLLNEFLKEHKKVEKLESTVATLVAAVRGQAEQIQKMSAQIEMSKATPNMVLNNQ